MRPLYIFDLDGTLADGTHRVHLIQQEPKQWDEYFEACDGDRPIESVIKIANSLHDTSADIWIYSGRSDQVRKKTVTWLTAHLGWVLSLYLQGNPEVLKMRQHGDHQPDDELKESWLLAMTPEDRERLVAVFDDRDRVVAMWRRNNVTCLQVAPGDF